MNCLSIKTIIKLLYQNSHGLYGYQNIAVGSLKIYFLDTNLKKFFFLNIF